MRLGGLIVYRKRGLTILTAISLKGFWTKPFPTTTLTQDVLLFGGVCTFSPYKNSRQKFATAFAKSSKKRGVPRIC